MAQAEARRPEKAIGRGPASLEVALDALTAEELAWRSQQGCRASFAELVNRYGARLLQFLRYRTDNIHDAEDLVQDTFVKVYENIGRYKDSWKFSTWLFTIAGRLASSHHRSSHPAQALNEVAFTGPGPADAMARQETHRSLWEAAATLPDSQCEGLWLRYVEGMSVKQIARVLGKSQVGVKVLLYRARVNIARRLEKSTKRASMEGPASFVEAGGA
jgi:RNA polymerase sigma-70 factor (ECF subfamily)